MLCLTLSKDKVCACVCVRIFFPRVTEVKKWQHLVKILPGISTWAASLLVFKEEELLIWVLKKVILCFHCVWCVTHGFLSLPFCPLCCFCLSLWLLSLPNCGLHGTSFWLTPIFWFPVDLNLSINYTFSPSLPAAIIAQEKVGSANTLFLLCLRKKKIQKRSLKKLHGRRKGRSMVLLIEFYLCNTWKPFYLYWYIFLKLC